MMSKNRFLLSLLFIGLFLVCSVNANAHTSIRISLGGGPVYYPAPVYYAPMPMRNVMWVPAHQERRWVRGHYVEYVQRGPVWMEDGFGRRGYWRRF